MREADVLLWIHQWANPWLDGFFLISDLLGKLPFLVGFALAMIGWNAVERRWRRAAVWFVIGLMTLVLIDGPKRVVARERPQLWPRLVPQGGTSFPSGHALASASLFTLAACEAARRWPRRKTLAYGLAIGTSLWLGIGRLYLGVHYPSDVVTGWVIGAGLAVAGMALFKRIEKEERQARELQVALGGPPRAAEETDSP
jgi:membrane-associated phospholipid phosphatase